MIIQTSIEIFDAERKELTGERLFRIVRISILLSQIEAVREVMADETTAIDPNQCLVYTKSGESYHIQTPYAVVYDQWRKTMIHSSIFPG